MQQYKNTVTAATGLPIEGATVTVTLAAGGAATLYSGNNTGALGSNVLTTGADGGYVFYAANGRYLLTIAAAGFAGDTIDVVLYDPDDPGADPGLQGMWPDVDAETRIHRARDRVFVGDGAAATGNRSGTQGGKVPDGTEGANWAIRDAQFLAFATQGNLAIVGFSRSEDVDPLQSTSPIGVAGFAIGNSALRSCWGLYSDVQFEAGPYAYGIEIAVKNKGANETSTPYLQSAGTYGIWLPGGGDDSYGGSPANPNNTAIAIGSNSSTWNKGIVFFQDGLTGTDGVTGTAIAIELAKGHRLLWRAPGNYSGFSIRSDVSAAASDVSMTASNNLLTVTGTSGKSIFTMAHVSSGVNNLAIVNAVTGAKPSLYAAGDDTDVDMLLAPKGSGSVVLSGLRNFANDAAAAAASPPVPIGGTYRNGSVLMTRVS